MAIGRISGSVLKSNLTRNGVDLAFETNLLYLDVTNSRVGIGTSEPTSTLHVNGDTTITGDLLGVTDITASGTTQTDIIKNRQQLFTTSNVMKFNQLYTGAAAGSYFTNGEYQKVVTITPSGDSQNYQVIGRITAQNAGETHVVNFNAALRSNTLPDLDWTILYDEEYNGSRYIDPQLWTKETTTAGFIFAFKTLATIYGTVTVDFDVIPRTSALLDNVSINTTQNSEQTSVDAGFTANDMTRVVRKVSSSVNVNGSVTATSFTGDGSGLTGINVSTNIQIVGDDSTGAVLGTGETFKIAGTQNVSTAVSGDTLTITGPDLTSYITASSTDTLTNKTFDVEGTGNSISNIDVADFKSGVLDTDLSSVSASDDTLASAKAIKAYVDQISTSAISEGNSNVTVTDSGTGAITIDADGSTIITMNATTVLDASATTNAVRLPNGTTAQRPSGSVGMIRYNSSTDTIEGYTTAGGWAQLGATTATAENTSDTSTGSATAISTTSSVIDQFVTSSFDSAWYLTVTRDEINNEVATAKHSLVHNDTTAFVATSHITESEPTNTYLTATADVAGGNARLLGTGASVVNSVSFYRISLGDNTTAGTTGNVTTSINIDVDSAAEKIDGWALSSYRGAKYYISVNNTTTGELSNTEALVVHDGSSAFITQYGNVNTGSNDLIILTAEIDSTEVIVKASARAPNCRVTVYRILLADDESSSTGNNVNVVEATTVDSSATTVDSFATTAYTGAFYVFTGYNSTEGAASIQEVMVVANDEAYVSQGPIVSTKGSDQLTFTASLSGTNVTVQASSSSGDSTTVNGYRVHMLRSEAGAATSDTVLVSTTQTITGAKTFDNPIALTVGSDPTTVADKAHIYAKDEAASAEVFVRDEAGNVTKISPHNQAGEWEYYSRNVKTGKTVRINMEEMIRDIEKLTGKTYIKND